MFYVFIHDKISTTLKKYFCGISKHLKMVLAFCSVMLSFFLPSVRHYVDLYFGYMVGFCQLACTIP